MLKYLISIFASITLLTGFNAFAKDDDKFAYDVVIINGRVMDPESGHDAITNVGIKAGKITSLSADAGAAAKVIDAKGYVVAPGFIDMHHHGINPTGFKMSAQDGVTTVLELEVGSFPLTPWYQRREGRALLNYGAAVSHQIIRASVMNDIPIERFVSDFGKVQQELGANRGWMSNAASPEQIAQMKNYVEAGIDEGGLGVGYHLATTLGSSREELLALFSSTADKGLLSFVHVRPLNSMGPLDAAKDIVDVARSSGAPLHMVHVVSTGLWQTSDILAHLEEARSEGVDVSTEVYPYTAAATNIGAPHVSIKMLDKMGVSFSDIIWVATGEEMTRETYAEHRQNNPQGVIIAHVMRKADVDMAITAEDTIIASDAVPFVKGRSHPRGAGSFSRVLGRYVRENKTLTLMQALNKMTLLPARRLEKMAPQMAHKGRIKVGADADITIFDPATVIDRATFKDADLTSTGIVHVLVNGVAVLNDGALVPEVAPGIAIRR